jgi:hypothetical protein
MNQTNYKFVIICNNDNSRAIYFFTYANTKSFLLEEMERETPLVHVTSAAAAGKILLLKIVSNIIFEKLKKSKTRN